MIIDTPLMSARRGESLENEITTLKHFFPCTNADGLLTDTKGGITWTPVDHPFAESRGYTMTYDNDLRAIYPLFGANETPVPLRTGTWATIPAGAAVIMVIAGRVICDPTLADPYDAATRFSLGGVLAAGTDTDGIGMSNGPWHWAGGNSLGGGAENLIRAYNSGGPSASINDTYNGYDVVQYILYQPGQQDYKAMDLSDYSILLEDDTVNVSTDSPAGLYSDTLTMPEITPGAYLRICGFKMYGAAIFVLPSGSLPADAEYACQWMGWAWKNGYRIPYPASINWS